MTPSATWVRRLPATSMTPHPVCRSPGSSPKTRISGSLPARSGAEPRHHVFGHFEIGVDILDIVAVLERLEQLEQASGRFLADFRGGPRTPDEARRAGRAESVLERIAHRIQILRRAGHRMLLGIALDVSCPGFDRGLEHIIGAGGGRRIRDLADTIEHKADTVGFPQGSP